MRWVRQAARGAADRVRNLLQSRDFAALHRSLSVLQAIGIPAPVEQLRIPESGKLRIAFIVAGMPRHSGGHTSILRLGTHLQQFGHEVHYCVIDAADASAVEPDARSNLPGFQGEIRTLSELDGHYDAGVATHWLTAYHLYQHRDRFSLKAYFVQDFEPAFYAEGDLHHLALQTYRLGLRMVCLGHWNAQRIRDAVGDASVRVVDFPVEPQQYAPVERVIAVEECLSVAVYAKRDSKRGPNLIFQGLSLLEQELNARGIRADFRIFGLDPDIKLPIGRNVGRLSHAALASLYRSCHLGITASFTNVSLVPYEMLMCGLPVLDWQAGSAPAFFGSGEMAFCGLYPREFARSVMQLVDSPELLNRYARLGQQAIIAGTWERTARQFLGALRD